MQSVDFVVPKTQGDSWTVRFERGQVPGRWPYGLEWLSDGSRSVSLRELEPPSRPARLLAAVPRRRRPGRVPIGLAWDENTARRMAISGRYGQMHCGVIWATDRWRDMGRRERAGVRRTLSDMSSVWTLSRAQLPALDDLLPTSTPRDFVKFGVDELFFSRARYPERPLILSVGGDRDRDHATILDAFTRVVRARPDTEAVIQARMDLGRTDGIRVVPHLTHLELRDLYRRASVVAVATLPNLHVSGMTVSLEAQATGRPVVLTDSPGASDYVADGTTGLLTASGDAQALADAIVGLLDDPQVAASMGESGRAAVERDLTSRHLAHRLAVAVGLT